MIAICLSYCLSKFERFRSTKMLTLVISITVFLCHQIRQVRSSFGNYIMMYSSLTMFIISIVGNHILMRTMFEGLWPFLLLLFGGFLWFILGSGKRGEHKLSMSHMLPCLLFVSVDFLSSSCSLSFFFFFSFLCGKGCGWISSPFSCVIPP